MFLGHGCVFSNKKSHVITVHITLLLIIMSGRMTGEFRRKLWAHSARDWSINNPECGDCGVLIIFCNKMCNKTSKHILILRQKRSNVGNHDDKAPEIGQLTTQSVQLSDYDERHCFSNGGECSFVLVLLQ